ncbi:MAG: GreA/GreB family elongation factor [Chloroflexi bacterium]|nr:GreA/GreB family elongation factor [Chloroflexota bacterium]
MSENSVETNIGQEDSGHQVGIGMHVTVEIKDKTGAGERLEFDVVPDAQSDFSAGFISEQAPLARAIEGRGIGEAVQYRPPSEAEQTVVILNVEPSEAKSEQPAPDRNDVLGQVMDKIARRESRQIALTTELHYGSIDADGIKDE